MKKLISLLLLLLGLASPAYSQTGFHQRADCVTLTGVTNSTECLQTTNANGRLAGRTYVWNGTIWAEKSASSAVNAQTGTTYTILSSDGRKLVTLSNASAIAVTLPQAGTAAGFLSGWFIDIQNRGAGTATITPTTSTIDGAASLVLTTAQGVRIFSDGTNYFTQRGVGSGESSGLAAHLADTSDAHDASAISVIPQLGLVSTNVQTALEELQAEIASIGTGSVDETANFTWTGIHDFSGGSITGAVIGVEELDPDDCNNGEGFVKAGGVWVCGTVAATFTPDSGTLEDIHTVDKELTTANSLANAQRIGDGVTPMCHYTDATLGPVIRPCTDSNVKTLIPTNFTWALYDIEGAAAVETVDPDAASKNAMYQYGAAYKPIGSVEVSLKERGAVTIALESIVTNQAKDWWATVTDANTDALDFRLPITAKMVGMTTATVRLVGVSKNAAPSGNVVLTCAILANRPGTDTYAAHSTTGEQTITLTPAVQNRPVAATSSAITLNGTVADGGNLWGSCEVDATGTTSAQMSDFRVLASAVVQFVTNSRSD